MIYKIYTKHSTLDNYGKTYFVIANNINEAQKAVLEVLNSSYSIYSTFVEADRDDIILNANVINNILDQLDPIENYFKHLTFINKLKLLFGGKI